MNNAKLLIRFGFVKGSYKELYKDKSSEEIKKMVEALSDKDAEKQADQEVMEKTMNQMVATGYPAVKAIENRRRTIYESSNASIEESYFWILNNIQEGKDGYPVIEKIIDTFAASEQSSFWGQSSTRLGVQQEKVSQYLATIGKMIKDLFQLVREIRILDERLSYYKDSFDAGSKSRESAEITLKGIYVDMAEGGSKNPSSVFGLARELQFTTLPDLFFRINPPTAKEVDEHVEGLDFNAKVKEVLKRKLRSYMEWKEHTYDELKTRKTFTLKYTRQHYDVIHMYLSWIRPYLRNIARLQSESLEDQKIRNADLVSAFETSMIEIEFLATHLPDKHKDFYSCILANFSYRTRPTMSYQQEGYRHQGPLHVGRVEVIMRTYAWDKEQIDNYKKMREAEDFEMIGKIDASVKAAMEALGDDLEKYLKEAEEKLLLNANKEDKKQKKQPMNLLGTFLDIKPADKKPKPKKKDVEKSIKEQKDALSKAKADMWNIYKNYKKSHGFLAW